MTAKEKADHLIAYFFNLIPGDEMGMDFLAAKECALYHVFEVLKVAFYANDEIYNFYLEVKQELENLK